MAPLVLLLTGLLIAMQVPVLKYQPTGDELYDRFARLTLKELRRCNYNAAAPREDAKYTEYMYRIKYVHLPAKLDYEKLRDWEADFKDDPRYWQLRVECGVDSVMGSLRKDDTHDLNSKLRASIDRGIADPASYILLPWNVLLDEDEDAAFKYLDKAVAADAGNCYWNYRKAPIMMRYGETDAAWEAVKNGNAAPTNKMLYPFPICTLRDLEYRSDAPGNQAVAGVIYDMEVSDIENIIKRKESAKEACICMALGYPLTLGDDWLTMEKRFGQAEGTPSMYPVVGTALVFTLVKYVTEECIEVEAQYRNEVKAVLALYSDLNDRSTFYGEVVKFAQTPGVVTTPYSRAMDLVYAGVKADSERNFPVHGSEFGRTRPVINIPDRGPQDWLNLCILSRQSQTQAMLLARELDIIPDHAFTRWADCISR
jgi:hypothetical protein